VSLAGAAALATCLLAAPPALAGPRPGERYDGMSATGQRIFLTVRADGSSLHRYRLFVRTRCSDGRRPFQGLLPRGERRVAIDATGAFSHRGRVWRAGFAGARGRIRFSFSGAFDATGDTASGTLRATFRSRRLDCSSGPVAFTVHRDGTAGAPWRDALMATGLYRARGRGVTARLRTLAPGREIVRGSIRFRARCRSGGTLRSGRVLRNYVFRETGRLRTGGRTSFRIPDDRVTVRGRYRLTLRFSGGRSVSGTLRFSGRVLRGGQAVDACRMRSAFSGAFVRGPA
jgi:hypothetical protein